ncbi:MAG: 30S ribosomal protein S12 methylthiotransferase RimO [Oscillospiraceae bacterium]|nr:30S ribosomal protein S12 methylthiotransferase RimO [Oscillospiraceae bacterium]
MKLAMISLGCPKNQVDADVIARALLEAGHETTASLQEADCIFVNTCGFIESAKQESIEAILEACQEKRTRPVKVVVSGCLAERYQSELAREIPEVDAVVGMGSNKDIVSILGRVMRGERLECYGPKNALPLSARRIISTPPHYAYIKIAEGCNNRCHYCAIPAIRGGLRSRPAEEIVAEAQWLAAQGVKELVVVAQDVTAYGDDLGENQIAGLLYKLNAVEGIRHIRLLYAYPERITDAFITAMKECEKVAHYLDMPVQHCNDRVLRAMNRKGDRAAIENAIKRLRCAMPDIVLRTTLIAGYPTETEEEFAELCAFVKEARFDRLGCFAYSQEENTVAAGMEGQLSEEIKQARADTVMRIQSAIMAEKQAALVGKSIQAVCDGYDPEEARFVCRALTDAPEIDTLCYVESEKPMQQGEEYQILVRDTDGADLYGVY